MQGSELTAACHLDLTIPVRDHELIGRSDRVQSDRYAEPDEVISGPALLKDGRQLTGSKAGRLAGTRQPWQMAGTLAAGQLVNIEVYRLHCF